MVIRRLTRSRFSWVVGALLTAVLVYLAVGVFGVQTLFYDSEVNEDFTATSSASRGQDPSQAAESTPRDPVVVSSGRFHAVAHPGTGDAIVYRLGDGSYVLRLENLDIFNGPALYVYAVAAEDANDNKTVLNTSILDLGPLKGNKGNQTYELPAEFNPEKYRAISVWCRRFSVNFATAPLG
jgi:hypothetical protein